MMDSSRHPGRDRGAVGGGRLMLSDPSWDIMPVTNPELPDRSAD